MKLKVPPFLVFLIFALLMYLNARWLPVGYFDFFGRVYVMGGLLVVAVAIILISLIQFFRAKTSVDPTKPSKVSSLVTDGLYKYSRNPMYLALLLLLLAWGLWLGNAFNTLLAALFVGYMNRFQILPEEEALLRAFGKEYQQYVTNVRRWF
ncbi:isoprenylcysteine carboxylmethyltransferase family protein [uncultured Kriegella sp.]|uniref:methyltransferase family protein n=1 Tax=uncultured Kriegella sp. TaxID=1798910 RepID=UPI0030DBBF5A|tara:strand:- start:427947 stop:428399 length:453 start_codon:yes stop_codon:yes gene_type:complete